MQRYNKVLVKLSGEALAGKNGVGFNNDTIDKVVKQLIKLTEDNFLVSVVIGGGNFWRGRTSGDMDRTRADQIGMLATVMNAIYVADRVRALGATSEVMTPFKVGTMTKVFSKEDALNSLQQKKIVFFAGGTGHPYFSTDSGAVLKGCEIEADILLFAKNIDGIYDSDPKINRQAIKYDEISCKEIIEKNLKAVDMASIVLCMENNLPIIVFDLNEENGIIRVANGENIGTKIFI
ncbi:MAG: UMP kinase [Epulopiscium sp. Nuni2H_MBin003]|nr:MAG: UMP kinase [Epulopiscium sp. Nuni2H_MBin003]